MKKRVFGRKFKKDINQRKALFKNLMRSFILNESIKTTQAKAKAIKGDVEKLATKAKVKGEKAREELLKELSFDAVQKLINEIAPRIKERPGGYTRILRLGNRLKDNASMVMMEWVDKGNVKTQSSKVKSEEKELASEKEISKVSKKKEEKKEKVKKGKDEKDNKSNKK